MPYKLLLIPLAPFLFVGFWCLICQLIARQAWRQLATHYLATTHPPGQSFGLGQATVGGVRYKNAVRASVSPQGLGLAVLFFFRAGHPPVLIPWAALGPLRAETSLWATFYTTTIQLPTGELIPLQFSADALAAALRPQLPPA
ncbi:hypothetical protein Q5H93_18240 [Hymenobacter sp. ASUV-10]|uniref:DUF3592 domain-containing protein n=1 Tax=Hymenobacter aranciens TaxID=3063996 RepID=A0ABT9BEK0_9BACT|nr:hypothetical protein [Hymenobacter sp. ASUV-10]MDO7876691.1 hypothetical protein [Hymenobacter sp. ASUV-10]